jgi:malate permease and related proteins
MSFSMVATYVGTPCLVVDALSASGLRLESLAAMGVGSVLCALAALVAGYALVVASRLPVSTYLPASTFANTGNIGLPLALFAFGQDGLALAIAYFAVHTVLNFTVGQALAARRFWLRETLASPLIWATALGGSLSVTGAQLPLSLARAAHILAGLTIPMMLPAPGYSLTKLKVKSIVWPLAFSALRLIGGFAIGWGVALALGMTGVPRGVPVIESAMPVAVYNYMFAARYKYRPEDVAGLVVLSTAMSVAALPVFLSSCDGCRRRGQKAGPKAGSSTPCRTGSRFRLRPARSSASGPDDRDTCRS